MYDECLYITYMQNFIYIAISGLFSVGLLGVFVVKHGVKKLFFLGLMQTSVIMLYVSAGYKKGGFFAPIYKEGVINYVNPVPHVLMLTAIVVGVAVSAVGLAMVIKIKEIKKISHK